MGSTRTLRIGHQRSEGELEGQLSKEQRDEKKKRLFLQQFEKEAQERIREMERKTQQLIATVDRAFKVELMKLTPQLLNTKMKDLMTGDDEAAGEVTIVMEAESPGIHRPLTRKTSKKGPAKGNATRKKRILSTQNETPLPATSKKTAKSKSAGAGASEFRSCSTTSLERTRGFITKGKDLAAVSKGQKRFNNLLGSPNPSATATATLLTSLEETLHLSNEIKDDIDVDMLDDTAVHQMRQLMQLMKYLCHKAEMKN